MMRASSWLACWLLLCACVAPAEELPCADPSSAEVVRVLDGDTMEVLLEGDASGTLVRLIGVNAPELNGGGAAAACHAEDARMALQALLSDDPIYLCTDVEETDRYQRLLAYAYAQDPLRFINLQLLEEGSACAYPFPPNTRHRDSFEAAEESARRSALGVWGLCPDGCGQP